MTTEEYKNKVIELFKKGKATEEQWKEMATAVLDASETEKGTPYIDDVIDPDLSEEDVK